MTAVHVHLTVPKTGTTDRAPARGQVLFSLYHRASEADRFVLTTQVAQVLVDGQATLQLTPTDGTNAWLVDERVPGGRNRAVAVPDSAGTVEYNALPELSLATLTPALDAVPAWTAAAVTASQARDAAVAAAASAQGYAAGSLQKTANLTDLASAPAARTALGLGTAAAQPATAFEPAGLSTSTVTSLAATYPAFRATSPSASERAAGAVGYWDTSTAPPVPKGWDGAAWVALGGAAATTPDNAVVSDIGDYITSDTGDYLVAA